MATVAENGESIIAIAAVIDCGRRRKTSAEWLPVLTFKDKLKSMKDVLVRHCGPGDYGSVVQIYNHYIEHSHATFDVTPYSVGARASWFAQFAASGPYQLLVAEVDERIVGFCCSTQFKQRPAYDVSVETTAYVEPDVTGEGIGRKLYQSLFAHLDEVGLHGAYAGVTLPNDASVALHARLGFRQVGVFNEVGRKFDQYWSVAWFERRFD